MASEYPVWNDNEVDLLRKIAGNSASTASGGGGVSYPIDLSNPFQVTGILPAANLGTGVHDATTFLRGDNTFVTIPGGGDALTSSPLSQFASTTSAQLAGVISDELGTGRLIFSAGTLAIAAGKTFTSSNTLTLTGTDGSTLNVGTGGTLSNGAFASLPLSIANGGTAAVTASAARTSLDVLQTPHNIPGTFAITYYNTVANISAAGNINLTFPAIASDDYYGIDGVTNGTRKQLIPRPRPIYIITSSGANYTATVSLLATNAIAGDVMVLRWVITGTVSTPSAILEIHDLTSAGTLLTTFTSGAGTRRFGLEYVFDGTNWSAITPQALAATVGGTGNSTYAVGDMLYASSASSSPNVLTKLAIGTINFALISSGSIPFWGAVYAPGGTDVAVADGGTGVSTLTGLVQGNGTSAFTAVTNSTTVGQVLRVTGSNVYGWGAVDFADTDAVTGTLAAAQAPAFTGGDVTSSAGSLTLTIANDAVTNAKLANMATSTVKARITGSTGDPEDATAAQINTLLQGDGSVAGAGGFRNIPQNSQSADYTTVLADSGKHLLHPSTDANTRTFTIAAHGSVAYPLGTVITFVNRTSQVLSIAITTDTLILAGTTTTGTRSLAQNGIATAIKLTFGAAPDIWIINGTGLT